MPITLGTNIAALQAQRRLTESSRSVSSLYERLSSGQRITRASDDAAGLSVSASLNVDSRIYTQAVRNINDTISATTIAGSAVTELKGVTARMRELSMQSANGIFSARQRSALDKEFQSLSKEYNRIIQTTTFNGINLFNSKEAIQIQVGRSVLPLSFTATETVGAGTFTMTQSGSTGVTESSIVAGDFNGDGFADFIGVKQNTNQVILHIGNNNGTFGYSTIATLSGATNLSSVTVADINQDSHLDVLFADTTSGNNAVQILLGNGDGSFSMGSRLTAEFFSGTDQIIVDDYDNDGVDDVTTIYSTGLRALVHRGNGDGTFKAPTTISGAFNGRLLGGDFNNDGNADFVSLNGGGGAFYVFFGNGDGTFSRGVTQSLVGTSFPFMQATDFDHDGAVDLIGGMEGGALAGKIQLFKNRGDGVFDMIGTLESYDIFSRGAQPVTSDFNGDGYVDIAAGSSASGSRLLEVFFGNGDGTFSRSVSYNPGAASILDLAVADTNSDGVDDIIMSAFTGLRAYKTATQQSQVGLGMRLMGHFDLSTLSIADPLSAKEALKDLDYYDGLLEKVGVSIGASESRLKVAASIATIQSETLKQAGARITDADIAQESASLLAQQIRQQFAISMLAQSNHTAQIALRLLS